MIFVLLISGKICVNLGTVTFTIFLEFIVDSTIFVLLKSGHLGAKVDE